MPRKRVVPLDQADFRDRTQNEAMPDVEIAATPVRIYIEIVLQSLRIIGAYDVHRLGRSIVVRVRERVSGDELEPAREASFQFHRERVVT